MSITLQYLDSSLTFKAVFEEGHTRGYSLVKRPLHNVANADKAKTSEIAQFIFINEHIELVFNAVLSNAVVMLRSLIKILTLPPSR